MKKVLFINGSPRKREGNSKYIVDLLRAKLGDGNDYEEIFTADGAEASPACAEVAAIVAVFPLYVDSLPHHMIRWLCSFGLALKSSAHEAIPTFAVVNCGFYEGEQNAIAFEILRNFCDESGLAWRGGAGIGTGEMLKAVKAAPEDMRIKRDISKAINGLVKEIKKALSGEAGDVYGPVYAHHGFPRIAYKLAGQLGWRQQMKANGVRPRELKARPYK